MTNYRNSIYEWEGDTTQPYTSNFTWESGRRLYPQRKKFICARMIADTGDRDAYWATVVAYQQALLQNNKRLVDQAYLAALGEDVLGGDLALNGDYLEDVSVPAAYSGDFALTVKFYVDDILKFTKEVYTNNVPFRIGGGGFRGRAWEVKIEGNVRVRRFDMSDSVEELKRLIEKGG